MKNGEYELVIAPPDYPGKLYRNKYCSKHVLIYWQTYGIIPKDDEIIHHKDEDKTNNDPSNLELMKRKDHVKLHKKRGRKMVELMCPACNKIFIREKRNTHLSKHGIYTCCSRKCSGAMSHISKENLQKKIKHNVIREFY